MKRLKLNIHKQMIWNISLLLGCLLLLTTLTGCFSDYGRVKRNSEITRAFQDNQVPTNYRYYYYGRTNMPYVIIGINPDYNLKSRIWREVKPDTAAFKEMTYWVWSDTYTYLKSPRGADIVDPAGKKIGIWYSNAHWAAVKMLDDQGNIMIAPDTPWMLGNR